MIKYMLPALFLSIFTLQGNNSNSSNTIFNGENLNGWKVPQGNEKAGWYNVINNVLEIRSGPKKKGSV